MSNYVVLKKDVIMVTMKLMKSHEQTGSLSKWYSYFQIGEIAIFIISHLFFLLDSVKFLDVFQGVH